MDSKTMLEGSHREILEAKKLQFKGVEGLDVYNITAPFLSDNKIYIAGRVEPRSDEHGSRVMFFIKENNHWALDKSAPVFHMQDPFICIIKDELILGGVQLLHEADRVSYSTAFFKGKSIHRLEKFAQGPEGMKDIRLIELPNGNIGMFTRPQGTIGGAGRIGFMTVESLSRVSELKDNDYYSAPLLKIELQDDEWLGANAAYLLKDGSIGVLGHIGSYSRMNSCDDEHNDKTPKNYYIIAFIFYPGTNIVSKISIIATRDDLPPGESKEDTLRNVLFAGGIELKSDGKIKVYAGASDAESYEFTIKDPFKTHPFSRSP